MKKSIIVISSIFMLLFVSSVKTVYAQHSESNKTSLTQKDDEAAVRACIDSFLTALGNKEYEKVKTMFLPNANIASIKITDGKSNIFTMTAEQYLSNRNEGGRKFKEPVRQFSVNISQGMLAFVRAYATVYYDDKASHHTHDFFILMKDNGNWKILSGSYTTLPLEKTE